MKKIVESKCPSCGAKLTLAKGEDQSFCPYCGAQLMISDENIFTIRNIDDAAIKRADSEKAIRLKQLDIEEKNINRRSLGITIWLSVTGILFIVGIIGVFDGSHLLKSMMLYAFNMAIIGCIVLFVLKRKDRRRFADDVGVRITTLMTDYVGKPREAVSIILRRQGFTNITEIALKDLGVFSKKKRDRVESVTIDGNSNYKIGEIYSKDAAVIINYHSKA